MDIDELPVKASADFPDPFPCHRVLPQPPAQRVLQDPPLPALSGPFLAQRIDLGPPGVMLALGGVIVQGPHGRTGNLHGMAHAHSSGDKWPVPQRGQDRPQHWQRPAPAGCKKRRHSIAPAGSPERDRTNLHTPGGLAVPDESRDWQGNARRQACMRSFTETSVS